MGQCTSTRGKGGKNFDKHDVDTSPGKVSESNEIERFSVNEKKKTREQTNLIHNVTEKKKDEGVPKLLEQRQADMGEECVMPLSYYNQTNSEILSDKQVVKQENESELEQRVFQLESDLQILKHDMTIRRNTEPSFIRKPANKTMTRSVSVQHNQIFRNDRRSDASVESGETAKINSLLSNSQVEDMCASTDFIKIFVDQIENVLIDCYLAHGLDFSVDFDFNLNFVSFNKKTSLYELYTNKERIPDEMINLFIDDVAEEYARSTNKPLEQCIQTITHKLAEVREQVEKVLHELIKCLEQRINSFCEKYVKVWKGGYELKRTSHVELDFEHFITSATLRFSASFTNILRWAGLQGKILEGHEFVDLKQIRSRSVFVDV